jgi:peptidoglycan hydrolase-like protein with peptidoglycan-binding domain
MTWRITRSLDTLRKQINAAAPHRSKASDGVIGDAAHSSRTSDHNPDPDGTVDAIDITHDPINGVDCSRIAEAIRASRDPRCKYLIFRGRIFGDPGYAARNGVAAWAWNKYTGSNPHNAHMHLSVNDRGQDDTTPWQIGPVGTPPPLPIVPKVPVLRRGSVGNDVRVLQQLLGVTVDGSFGPQTEQALVAFQTRRQLLADGVAGVATWAALRSTPADANARQTNITASVFGGPGDEQASAYGGRIDPSKPGVALPARFASPRPRVRVHHKGKHVDCEVADVGPWLVGDRYWAHGLRPYAESGRDFKGRKTNKAGIDLTPSAARAIGLNGLGLVDWEFI